MEPFRKSLVAGLALALAATSPQALAAKGPDEATFDKQAGEIFDLLRQGKSLDVVDASIGRSPLMAGKEAERQSLAAQIDAARRVYGPITAVEMVKQTEYGSMLVKRFYVIQHEKMLTRWELNFSKLKTGWIVTYIGFEDQARSWE